MKAPQFTTSYHRQIDMYNVHCTIYIVHYTLYTLHTDTGIYYGLEFMLCIMYSLQRAKYTYCKRCHYSEHSIHYTVYIIHVIEYTLYCIQYQYTVYTVNNTV